MEPGRRITSYQDIPRFPHAAYEIDVGFQWLEQQLAEAVADGLNIDPPFQRAHVWTEAQQSAYVEYLLRGGEVSRLLIVNAPHWQESSYKDSTLVDGKQRLEAVRRFMRDDLPVFGTKRSEFKGVMRLDGRIKWRVVALESEAQLLDLYLAINAGGTTHTPEELDKVRAMRERLRDTKGAQQ